ncbi:MAG TPA: hypothetical protein PK277_01010 [Methanoregulaceae archaeon]|nr:hypothetical protein [Methanoregulaceae archaeon]
MDGIEKQGAVLLAGGCITSIGSRFLPIVFLGCTFIMTGKSTTMRTSLNCILREVASPVYTRAENIGENHRNIPWGWPDTLHMNLECAISLLVKI